MGRLWRVEGLITDSWTKKFRNSGLREKHLFVNTQLIPSKYQWKPALPHYHGFNWTGRELVFHATPWCKGQSGPLDLLPGISAGTSRLLFIRPSLVSFNPQTVASAESRELSSSPEQWTNLMKLCQYGWLAICYPTCVCRGKSCSNFPYSRVGRAHGPPKASPDPPPGSGETSQWGAKLVSTRFPATWAAAGLDGGCSPSHPASCGRLLGPAPPTSPVSRVWGQPPPRAQMEETAELLVGAACHALPSVVSQPLRPRGLQPARPLCPWDFPGKNTSALPPLLRGILRTKGSNRSFSRLRHGQAGSPPWATRTALWCAVVLVSALSRPVASDSLRPRGL